MNIYLDNSSTTFPKPKNVVDSICNFLTNIGGNPGRSNHNNALQTNRLLFEAREIISDFFKFNSIENVIFTNNITTSLNILINGSLVAGDHVITSSMEHNSVLRPLVNLKNKGIIELDIINADKFGFVSVEEIRSNIKINTKMIVLSQASNVIGSIQPIKEIGTLCKSKNIFFILDTAQGAGVLDIDFTDLNLSALAFTGHKSLFGPQGIGGFIIDDSLNNICKPFILGGTGSLSHSLEQPDFLPDKFESGTLNMPGIVGLVEGIKFIKNEGINTIYNKNKFLRNHLINEMSNIKDIILYEDINNSNYTSCVSFNINNIDTAELSFALDNDFGIKNRSGLHCAPLAHKTIGSFPSGTVRLSLSYFNEKSDINYTIDCINKILKSK
ncbi:aminotransferase class V-fold PLP-dependent enzyme [Clostridium tertium]|jgi:cysteine desulfurase family protein|uniref:aminotransferase class V-fold PLP-dependent enzyme n=1 Tax=Clostridium tertium TaxID=1559 RepID=UPI0018AB035F|nr:aminotransferase class V-fold PLP-dependent enzyme [Clostridium tertium]MBU6137223.1 aminotransferase class V-fold PLP-dependent enzyme [Clostridium tertium]